VSNVYLANNHKVIQCNIRDITERKRAEEDLSRVNSFLDSIIENIPNMVFIKEAKELRFVRFNKSGEILLGIPSQEIIGKNDYDFFSKEQADFFIEKDRDVLKFKKMIDIPEEQIQTKHQGIRILHTKKVPILNEMGEQEYLLGISEDITDRNMAEKALKESEEKYRFLVDKSTENIWTRDLKLKYTYISPSIIRLTGFTVEEEMERTIDQCYTPKTIQLISETFAEEMELEAKGTADPTRNRTIELETYKKDGSIAFLETSMTFLRDDKLMAYGIYGITRDITERKKAEKIIKENEIQYQNLADSGSALIWTSDTNKLCNYFNKPWLEFTGKTLEQELGNGWADGVHRLDIEKCFQTFVTAFDKREKFYMEYRILHNSGEYRWISDMASPVYGTNGEFTGYIGHCFDITERKAMENELISAKEQAEESDKLKTAFLQNMSHEIRTPLNGIIGFSKLLNTENLSKEDIIDYTSVISLSGKRLLEVVNDILDISRIQTGQVIIENKQFSINSIFSDLLTFFSHIANSKNITLNYHGSDIQNAFIISDESRLYQILTNLINNAIKFTESGSIDFGYEFKENLIEFYVKDTGIGISPDLFERIFDRFTQADMSISRGYEGTGLGLSISKGLLELLGGKIWFESELNKGTTFFFTLPYTPKDIISQAEPIYSDETNKIIRGKILVAEDDLVSFQYLNNLLEKLGLKVIRAENGVQAVEIIKRIPDIDLILMDIRMPVMDGIEATKLIKEIKPDICIIAQTAYAFTEERLKILSIGCDDYLSKPLDSNKVIELINKYLD
jgi:PAS domain S-box-containing protein